MAFFLTLGTISSSSSSFSSSWPVDMYRPFRQINFSTKLDKRGRFFESLNIFARKYLFLLWFMLNKAVMYVLILF
jgi:hypothetical protein